MLCYLLPRSLHVSSQKSILPITFVLRLRPDAAYRYAKSSIFLWTLVMHMYHTPTIIHTVLLGIGIKQFFQYSSSFFAFMPYRTFHRICTRFTSLRFVTIFCLWFYLCFQDCFTATVQQNNDNKIEHNKTLYIFHSSLLDKMAAILADGIFKCIFLNEKLCILIKISLKFVPKGLIDNNAPLV